MEWLEAFSLMQMEWKQKWLSFTMQDQVVKLQCIPDVVLPIHEITCNQLLSLYKNNYIWQMVELYLVESPFGSLPVDPLPVEMAQLVEEFLVIFEEPSGIPPPSTVTHSIPLMNGTQPFRLKPFRYTPAQKDETETQIAHLLKSNMIQESTSPFASPVLLVKKKSGEWRLCVDYRRLNAYTVKNKFPMPIVEELFEELDGAC
jgi:hypothetical protein